jgi:toxin ParE1/3/4
MNSYILGEDAMLDLEAIWEFIAQDKPSAADSWIARLFAAFDRLAIAPGLGHKRQDLTSDAMLFWPVGEYLILYRLRDMDQTVEIMAVTQGSRNMPGFLSKRRL